MASYSVFLKRTAAKELKDVGSMDDRRRIVDQIAALADDPRPSGHRKLAGREDSLRVRQRDYRIVYSVDDDQRVVTIVKIGHRKDVYRSSG